MSAGNDRIQPILDRFSVEMERVIGGLDVVIGKENAKQTVTSGDGDLETQPSILLKDPKIESIVERLSDCLDKHDADAIALIAEIRASLKPSDGHEMLLKLESQINSFKFEEAKETLDVMTKAVNF
jgi:hypothetical protein